jgi:hypothetical protein
LASSAYIDKHNDEYDNHEYWHNHEKYAENIEEIKDTIWKPRKIKLHDVLLLLSVYMLEIVLRHINLSTVVSYTIEENW